MRFPAIAVAVGLGLLTIAFGITIARGGSMWAEPLFWTGMLMLWVPSTAGIVRREATRGERIALLVLLGMAMYLVYILLSPRYFVVYDDLLHWRTAQDMVRTGRVFNANPGLPISPLYPGLEIATSAIAKLTGLPVLVAGRLVVAVARLVMILALYLLYERVGRSSRLAGVAVAVYFTNPEFLFFDSGYGYESLAIPLAFLVLFAVQRGTETHRRNVLGATLLVLMPLLATVVTHHATSVILVLGLVVLATLALYFDTVETRFYLWGIAAVGAGLVVLWIYLVAGQVISYLQPYVVGGITEVIRLIRGEGASRELFQSYVGQPTPLVDQVGSFAFAAITIFALFLGVLQIWRTHRYEIFPVAFALTSLAYPLSGLFHFTVLGAQLGQRLPAMLFVSVSYCVAVAVAASKRANFTPIWTVALVLIGTVLLYGGITTGSDFRLRLPGPYLVSANQRSIEPEGIAAASWAGRFLPHNSRIGVDRINEVLMLTYGDQWPVTSLDEGTDLAPVFLSRQLTLYDRQLVRSAFVHYLVVDYRLTRFLPVEGFYYDEGEPGAGVHNRPVPMRALQKFDRAPGASRIFDSGDIAIFDVSGLIRHGS